MRVLRDSYELWEPVPEPAFVTIGVFDGVHRGHQAILATLRERAAEGTVAVVTFREHPATVVRPDQVPPMLTTIEQRLELFEEFGVDVVAVLEFHQVWHMEPAEFVAAIVSGVMRATHVAVGQGFRFGHEMAGDAGTLASLGEPFGYTLDLLDIVGGDVPVRSTVIRDALATGDVERAAAMLGRPFQLRGDVIVGDRRGRQLGFPTANLELDSGWAIPQHGVYAALTRIADGSWRRSVVNVGIRPTFGGLAEVVEVHLLDSDLDLYGQELHVDFVSRIRAERRFDGIDELVEQIGRDVRQAEEHLTR